MSENPHQPQDIHDQRTPAQRETERRNAGEQTDTAKKAETEHEAARARAKADAERGQPHQVDAQAKAATERAQAQEALTVQGQRQEVERQQASHALDADHAQAQRLAEAQRRDAEHQTGLQHMPNRLSDFTPPDAQAVAARMEIERREEADRHQGTQGHPTADAQHRHDQGAIVHHQDIEQRADAPRLEAQRLADERLKADVTAASQAEAQRIESAHVAAERTRATQSTVMTLSELYDHMKSFDRAVNHFNRLSVAMELNAVIDGVREAIRTKAPDYAEMACAVLMAPRLGVTLVEASTPV